MGIFDNLFGSKSANLDSSAVDMGEEDYVESGYNFDVVGESFQRDHLVALLKKNKVIEVGEFATSAMLELEPTNDFDPNAVKVMVDGLQVGYVPKTFSGDVSVLRLGTAGRQSSCDSFLGCCGRIVYLGDLAGISVFAKALG